MKRAAGDEAIPVVPPGSMEWPLEKSHSSPGRLGARALLNWGPTSPKEAVALEGVTGTMGVGTWACGCGNDPRCARRQLSSDVRSLLSRHQNEMQWCLDRWSAKQEAFINSSVGDKVGPKFLSPSVVAAQTRPFPIPGNGNEGVPLPREANPGFPGGLQVSPVLKVVYGDDASDDFEEVDMDLVAAAASEEDSFLLTTPSRRRSRRKNRPVSAASAASPTSEAPPEAQEEASSSHCAPSGPASAGRGGGGARAPPGLRMTAETVDESSVWITDLKTPDSFKLHSRLDHMQTLEDTGESRERSLGYSSHDSQQDTMSSFSQRRAAGLGGLVTDSPSPRPIITGKGTPQSRRLPTAWDATGKGGGPATNRSEHQPPITQNFCGSPPEKEAAGTFDRWAKTVASGKKRNTWDDLKPLSSRKAQGLSTTPQAQARVERFVKTPKYECASAAVILLNAFFIVLMTDHRASAVAENRRDAGQSSEELLLEAIGDLFCLFFMADLSLRLYGERARFFRSRERAWNILDLFIVTVAVLESISHRLPASFYDRTSFQAFLGKFSMLRIVRLLRVIRFTRAIRVCRFFKELRVMVYSLAGAMKSLAWAIVLMLIILLIFGVFFTDGVTSFALTAKKEPLRALPADAEEMARYFGSIPHTTVSLYMAMSGGVDWGEIYETLSPLPFEYKFTFLIFITFSVMALLNIVTAVFVESAMQRSQTDRELIVQMEQETKLQFVDTMQRVFEELDQNGSGTLTLDEFEMQIQDENILSYLSSLDLEIDQVRTLLTLLDRDQNGEVDIEEFITGCLRLKGGAKSLDMAILQYQIEWMMHNVEDMKKCIEERVGKINDRDYLLGSDLSKPSGVAEPERMVF